MRTAKSQMIGGMVIVLLSFCVTTSIVGGDEPSSDSSDEHPGKIRHGRKLGKYKYKEEVIKRVEFNHPCRLAQTAVKVTFPGMKSEVLVSFLGYKEPNLMHVMRCKGLCSNKALSPVACVPTKRKLKRVKMRLKTQVLGSDAKEKFQELVLEEHEECGCQCLSVSPGHCLDPDSFNNETCSCACDNSPFGRDQLQCEAYSERKWDGNTCTCRHKDDVIVHQPSIGDGSHKGFEGHSSGDQHGSGSGGTTSDSQRRGHDTVPAIPGCNPEEHSFANCLGQDHSATGIAAMPNSTTDNSSSIRTWTAIGICSFFIAILAFTTYYYRRKSRELQVAKSIADDDDALLVPSSTFLEDKFPMKSMEAVGSQVTLHECGDISVAPSVKNMANICDNQKAKESEARSVGLKQQHPGHNQVVSSQSQQSLGTVPIRLLGDDGGNSFSGFVNALLNARSGGTARTHEVVVHSPPTVANGGNSLAKAASMSELDQSSIVGETALCLHSGSVGSNLVKSNASLGAVDFLDVGSTSVNYCDTCLHSSLSRPPKQRHHQHNYHNHQRSSQQHTHRSKHRHHQHHHHAEELQPSHGHKVRHRPRSQEHLIDPELAAEILQKCLLSLSDQSGFVIQKIAQQHLQQQAMMDHQQHQLLQHQVISHPQASSQIQHHVELPQRQQRNKRIRVSSSTATSPC